MTRHLKQWGLFLIFLLVCGWEGNLLPFNSKKRYMFADNFGLDTRDAIVDDAVNLDGMEDAWRRWHATHDLSHDGVNVGSEWGRLNAQRTVKFLCAIILDLLIAVLLVWVF